MSLLIKTAAQILAEIGEPEPDYAANLGSLRPSGPDGLTLRQREHLAAIRDYAAAHDGVTPTDRELAELLGITITSVQAARNALAAKGVIRLVRAHTRKIRLVEDEGS